MNEVIPRVGQWIEGLDAVDPGYVVGLDLRRRTAKVQWLSRDDDSPLDSMAEESGFPFSEIACVIENARTVKSLDKKRAMIMKRAERRNARCRTGIGRSY